MKTTGRTLARFYGLPVKAAHYHNDGNWYWNLHEFPAAYFDANGCVIFQSEEDYLQCVYLTVGPANTGVRGKDAGISIADIPGYQKLDPAPHTIQVSN